MKDFLKKNGAFLFIVLTVSAALRLYKLEYHSLWSDELTVWSVSKMRGFFEMLHFHIRTDMNPPGYWVLQYVTTFFLDDSEFSVRLPVALAGVFATLATFFMGKSLYNARVGFVASLLLALSYRAVYLSQEARPYSFCILFAAVTGFLFSELIKKKWRPLRESPWLVLSYISASIFLSYLHYFGSIVVFVQALTYLLVLPKERKNFIKGLFLYIPIFIAFLPWLFIMVGQFSEHQLLQSDHYILQVPKFSEIADYHKWLFGRSSVYSLATTLSIIFYFLKRKKYSAADQWRYFGLSAEGMLLVWVFAPFCIAYLLSVTMTPMLTYRYLCIGLPPIFVLIGASVDSLRETVNRKYAREFSAIVLTLFVIMSLSEIFVQQNYYGSIKKETNRRAVTHIIGLIKKYPSVRIAAQTKAYDIGNYYFDRLNAPRKIEGIFRLDKEIPLLKKFLNETKTKYLIYWGHGMHGVEQPAIRYLVKKLKLVEEKKMYRNYIWVFQLR